MRRAASLVSGVVAWTCGVAEDLRDRPDVHFEFVEDGASRRTARGRDLVTTRAAPGNIPPGFAGRVPIARGT